MSNEAEHVRDAGLRPIRVLGVCLVVIGCLFGVVGGICHANMDPERPVSFFNVMIFMGIWATIMGVMHLAVPRFAARAYPWMTMSKPQA